jgi:hypothetical protein
MDYLEKPSHLMNFAEFVLGVVVASDCKYHLAT